MKNCRWLAALVLLEVESGRSLTESLAQAVKQCPKKDTGLLQELCFGVCRHYYTLMMIADSYLQKAMKVKDRDVYILLLIGLYQLTKMRVPTYAAISETVSAVNKKPWAKSVINGILRRFDRDKPSFPAHVNHPEWFVSEVKTAWPLQWQAILQGNDERPPLSLRVNQRQVSREAYLALLSNKQISAAIIPETKCGIQLAEPTDIENLPHFFDGYVSVQDGAAQLAVELLEVQSGMRVLDACAAPGGKTGYLAESADLAELIAIDQSEKRLKRVQENLTRLNLSATCITSDASAVHDWWDGQLFDRILVDAPCTASGVIRRHPDIKLLRKSSDLEDISRIQTKILGALWPLLKQDGRLIYTTCSIFPQENTKMVQNFLSHHSDAEEVPIEAIGIPCPVGRQILPGVSGMDGFYYARLRKK
jgi:16S rRNA (cytosine967-C5)-methyltransferase